MNKTVKHCEICNYIRKTIKNPDLSCRSIVNNEGYKIYLHFLDSVTDGRHTDFGVVLVEIRDNINYSDRQYLLNVCPYCGTVFNKLKENL